MATTTQKSVGSLKLAANQLQVPGKNPDAQYWAVVQKALVLAQDQLDSLSSTVTGISTPTSASASGSSPSVGPSPSRSPVAFVVNTGAIADDAALCPLLAAASSVTRCIMYVKASDPAIDLTFDVTRNGTSIFSAPITIAAATVADTEITSTALTPYPLLLQAGDKYKLNITSGSDTWMLTIQLET